MSEERPVVRSRLVVTLGGDEDSLRTLEAAVRLAARLRREMVGLFLEDADLMAAASLPFVRIVSHGAAQEAWLDPASTRRAMRVMAERARRALARSADARGVRWSFRTLSGNLGDVPLEASDVLTLGTRLRRAAAGGSAGRPLPCPAVLIGRGWGPVLIVYEGGAEALAIGAGLAIDGRLPLVVLCLESGLATAGDRVAEARRRLGPDSARATIETLEDEDEHRLEAAIRGHGPSLVVLDTCRSHERLDATIAALTPRRRQHPG